MGDKHSGTPRPEPAKSNTDSRTPSPVEPVTKSRTSSLFRSPPVATEKRALPEGRSRFAVPEDETQDEFGVDTRHTSIDSTPMSPDGISTRIESDDDIPPSVNSARDRQSRELEPIAENEQEDVSPTRSRYTTTDDFDSRFHWPPMGDENQTSGADQTTPRTLHQPNVRPKANSASPITPEAANSRRVSAHSSSNGSKAAEYARPLSALSARSRTPSVISNRSGTPTLRRSDRSLSGDLRAANRRGEAQARDAKFDEPNMTSPASDKTVRRMPSYDPLKGSGRDRRLDMSDAPSYVSLCYGWSAS